MSAPRSAHLAVIFAVVAVVAIAGGVAGAHFGFLPPYSGFALFGLGLILGSLPTLIVGIVGLCKTRGGGVGQRRAGVGTAVGAGLTVGLAVLVVPLAGVPPIHDVTTNPDDPPAFREIAKLPGNEGRDLTYPHGGADVPARQREAYPGVEPIRLDIPPERAFIAAKRAAAELGWSVVWANGDLGVLEATETSRLFRFSDDIVVRIRAAPGGTSKGAIVDVRSTSRVGVSDLGANARRIDSFAAELQRLVR